jgi:uncharacterized protein with HEPN domain
MQRDDALLLDKVNYAKDALAFTRGVTWEQFAADRRLQHATQYALLIIGEAAGKLSQEFRAAHPELPWLKIIAFRHRMVHDYPRIELPKVWDVVQGRPAFHNVIIWVI